ncbi:MAG: FecCD family ABC transporter permease [Candidatus Methanomethylophilaceae archaeon]
MTKATWNELGLLFAVIVPVLIYFLYKRLDYNSMEAGEEVAMSLGIDTKKLTIVSMVLASVVAAVSVSIVGIIGFVGLLGPHITRRLIGGDHRFLLPASAAMGALILLISDFVGRALFIQAIPVGIITSFLGGPLFLYILIKKNKR